MQTETAAPSIEEALDQQRRIGQTAAQHQSMTPGDFIARANAAAREQLAKARARGPIGDQVARVDLSEVDAEHVHAAHQAMSPAVMRGINRVAALFPSVRRNAFELRDAIVGELTLEFHRMQSDPVNYLTGASEQAPGAVENTETAGQAGTMSSAGTVASQGTVSNAGTAGA